MRSRRRTTLLLPALLAMVCLCGCGKTLYMHVDEAHSANLIAMERGWPGSDPEDLLTPEELDVFRDLGRPNLMRMLFNRAGDVFLRERAQHEIFARGGHFEEIERSWIYKSRELEVCFQSNGTVESRPLSQKLLKLVEYGDPHEIKTLDGRREKWFYYDRGFAYTFDGDLLVKTDTFQPTGFRRF